MGREAELVAAIRARPFATGPTAVAAVDAFLRAPAVSVAEVDYETARTAAKMVKTVVRLPDALIAATAIQLGLPMVTGDRRLARAFPNALLVADYA